MATKKWEYQYSPTNNTLYKRSQQQYTVHTYNITPDNGQEANNESNCSHLMSNKTITTISTDITPVNGIVNEENISINGITTILKNRVIQLSNSVNNCS